MEYKTGMYYKTWRSMCACWIQRTCSFSVWRMENEEEMVRGLEERLRLASIVDLGAAESADPL